MFLRVAAFELRYQLRQPLFWAVAAMFAVLSFTATITDALAIGGAIGSLNRNAPFVVVRMLGNLSLVGAFMIVAFVATSALRDFEHRTDELVFSRPVRHPDLLFGRFAGSVLACGHLLRICGRRAVRWKPHALARAGARRPNRRHAVRLWPRRPGMSELHHPRRGVVRVGESRPEYRGSLRRARRRCWSATSPQARCSPISRAEARRRSSTPSALAPSTSRPATGRSSRRTHAFRL